jgi:hypothetical protein
VCASYACIDTWLTDFRDDLPKIDVPALVMHGSDDQLLPYEATAKRLPGLVKDLKLVTVEGGPHNIAWNPPRRGHPSAARLPWRCGEAGGLSDDPATSGNRTALDRACWPRRRIGTPEPPAQPYPRAIAACLGLGRGNAT